MGPHLVVAAQLGILQSIGLSTILHKHGKSQMTILPLIKAVFPFQPTNYHVTTTYDCRLFEGLTSDGALVLGYFRPGLAHGFKNRQNLVSWFLQKKRFQVVFSGSPKTNQLEVKEIKF
jgi:hypothetical protein